MIAHKTETDILFDEITAWTRSQLGWKVTRQERIHEDVDFSYLELQTPQGKIHVEPIGKDRTDSYIAEMYAWPTLIRVFLVRKPGSSTWEVRTDAGIPFHWDWNEQNFVRPVNDLQVLP